MTDEKHATPIATALADAYSNGVDDGHAYAAAEILRLRAEVEKLRAALQFYAEEKNWRRNGPLDTNSGNFTAGPAKEVLGE
jgi:hypothetical protein